MNAEIEAPPDAPEGRSGPDSGPAGNLPSEPMRMPRWKKVLLGCAALFVVVGVALALVESPAENAKPAGSAPGVAPSGLIASPGSAGGSAGSAPEGDAASSAGWSPFFLKGGFGLLIGFSIGVALRTFFKLSALLVGVVALALFGLSYAGLVEVQWAAIEGHFDDLWARVGDEAGHFKTFVTGSLPTAGLTGFGLFAGFKRS